MRRRPGSDPVDLLCEDHMDVYHPSPCLFHFHCGGSDGTREHIFPASLGGRKKFRRLLCGACQSHFSKLDQVLPQQLRFFNLALGVRPDHRRKASRAIVVDPVTKRRYLVDDEFKLSSEQARLVSQRVGPDGNELRRYEVTGPEGTARLLKQLAAEGVEYEMTEVDRRPTFFARPPRYESGIGEEDGFRAAARIVLNFIGWKWGDLARDPGLEPAKRWILGDAANTVTWHEIGDFGIPLPPDSLPECFFPFGHRVIVAVDADGSVFGRVCFFDAVDFALRMGKLTRRYEPRLAVWDVDPLAEKARRAGIVSRDSEHLSLAANLVGGFISDAHHEAVNERAERRLTEIYERSRTQPRDQLIARVLPALNDLAGRADPRTHERIADLLTHNRQVAFTHLTDVVAAVAAMLEAEGAPDAVLNAIRDIAETETDSPHPSRSTLLLAELIFVELCGDLARRLESGPLSAEVLHSVLFGDEGRRIAFGATKALMIARLELLPENERRAP